MERCRHIESLARRCPPVNRMNIKNSLWQCIFNDF